MFPQHPLGPRIRRERFLHADIAGRVDNTGFNNGFQWQYEEKAECMNECIVTTNIPSLLLQQCPKYEVPAALREFISGFVADSEASSMGLGSQWSLS